MQVEPFIFFTGKYEKTVDAKRRVNLPAILISQVASKTFNITRGQDQDLYVYPQEVFVKKAMQLNENFGSRGEQDLERRLYFQETLADAQPVQADQQGRIILPQSFLEYAKIDTNVLIIGAVDKLIFWNPDLYHSFIQSSQLSEKERVNQYGWGESKEQ